ncbi:MAG: rod shape-determining protein MreD [Bacillaceae bacterium]|nr:rod shape-determining protein MreD [Bacillaceae bacterium]
MNPYVWLSALLTVLLLLEGTVLQFVSPDTWGITIQMIPRFVVVGVIYIALYLGRRKGLWYGLIFGLLQDILYSDVIGVYAFGMGLVGYFSGLAFKLFHQGLLLILLTMIVSILIYDLVIYSFFSMFGIASVNLQWMMMNQLIPTLFLNAIFAVLIYVPMKKILEGIELEEEDRE